MNHTGSDARITAVTEELRSCSAQTTAPFPKTIIKKAGKIAAFHSEVLGGAAPDKNMRMIAEITDEDPANKKGGMLCTAKRIAKYREPQPK